MKCDEIFAALAMLEKERGIPQSFMMGKIIQALTTAYKRDHEGVEYVVVDVDEEKKDLKMYVQKEIVEEVENPASQISLEEAKHISAKNELGGMVNFPVESVEFGRIAAGNGKQVIIQGLREAEHGMIYDEWGSKQHEILTGTVSRIDPRNGNVILRIGSGSEATEAVLTMNEQVPGEELHEGQMVKEFNDWCFDDVRQPGDYGIVKTEFGYHLMFFVGSNPIWKDSARSDLSNARANELLSTILDKHTVETDFGKIKLGYASLGA